MARKEAGLGFAPFTDAEAHARINAKSGEARRQRPAQNGQKDRK